MEPAPAAVVPEVVNLGMASWGDNKGLAGGRLAFHVREADQRADLNGDGDWEDAVAHVWDPVTGTRNLGLSANLFTAAEGGQVTFQVWESSQGGTDLNGDGDANDNSIHVWDPATGVVTNLRLGSSLEERALPGGRVAFQISEADHGNTDLNADGDASDWVIHVWHPLSGLVNLGIASVKETMEPTPEGGVAFLVSESAQDGDDRNGDGSAGDGVPAVWDPAGGHIANVGVAAGTRLRPLDGRRLGYVAIEAGDGKDRNGDGDTLDRVAHVWEASTGTNHNLRLAAEDGIVTFIALDLGRLAFTSDEAQQSDDLNGDGDEGDDVVHVWDAATGTTNLRLAADSPAGTLIAIPGGGFTMRIMESEQDGSDLNDDGDAQDRVIHVWEPSRGTLNLGLAFVNSTGLEGGRAAFGVSESSHGRKDLNADGDTDDAVLHVWDPLTQTAANLGIFVAAETALDGGRFTFWVWEEFQGGTDLNGDGDATDDLLYLWDPLQGVIPLGLAGQSGNPFRLAGGSVGVLVVESEHHARDLNGDGDVMDHVLHVVKLGSQNPPTTTTTTTSTTMAPPPSSGGPPAAPSGPAGDGNQVTPAAGSGYWMVTADGSVFAFGGVPHHGNATKTPGAEIVDIEPSPSGRGYWTLDTAGKVSAFGDAALGISDRRALNAGERVTALSATPSGHGYWLFTTQGRVFTFGDAPHLGDMTGTRLNGPVLDSVPTLSGLGYYMVASDGGIFTFGDAVFRGSMGGRRLNAPVQSLVPAGNGAGYWLVASDGGIFAFDAPFRGSMGSVPLNRPVTGMVRLGDGYLMVGEDGGIFNFSSQPFHGSLGADPPASPVTSVAAFA
jgi:hypothetical protein